MISIWFVCAHAHNSFSSCECPMCHAHSAAFVWVERIEIKTATTKYLAQAQRSLNVCCLFRLVTIVMTFLSENLNWKIAYTTTRKKWRKIFLYVAHFHWEIIEFGAYVCVSFDDECCHKPTYQIGKFKQYFCISHLWCCFPRKFVLKICVPCSTWSKSLQ